jgi:hypothetical protein
MLMDLVIAFRNMWIGNNFAISFADIIDMESIDLASRIWNEDCSLLLVEHPMIYLIRRERPHCNKLSMIWANRHLQLRFGNNLS